MPPPEEYKNEVVSQPATCQVHITGTYVSLLAPEKARVHRLPRRKDYHVPGTYIFEKIFYT